MWRSRLFWRLFCTYSLMVLFSVVLLGLVITRRAEENELKHIEKNLRDKAMLCREIILRSTDARASWNQLASLVREQGARITLIAADGTVLLDSHEDPAVMDDHGKRPEVCMARRTDDAFGMETRFGTTVQQPMMYVAMHNRAGGDVAFVRVAIPLTTVERRVAFFTWIVWTTGAATIVVTLVLAFWMARRIASPLRELAGGVGRIADGGFGHKVYVGGGDEVAKLALSFNHMSTRLADQFRQLDDDRQRLRAVLESMVEGVVAIDGDQRILFANERGLQLLDLTPQPTKGRHLWELVRQRALQDVVKRAFAEGTSSQQELEWAGPDPRNFMVHMSPLGEAANGVVLVFHDVTQLRYLERVRQEFIANVSHELKTPLSVIIASAETLLDGGSDDKAICRRFLQQINEQSNRLQSLIQDMLTLARIESASQPLTLQRLSLADAASGSLERHSPRAEKLRRHLRVEAAEDVVAWADADAVREILDNLVDNSLKYTPEEGTITVSYGRQDGKAFLRARDTGIGIPKKDLARIFERFYRVDKARSRELGGTGLGLSIVKHLTQEMNGSVDAESELGRGSVITIYLPTPPDAEASDGLERS